MENFSTPKLAMVPRVVNLVTLVFLVGTTWWSSAQRPVVHEASAVLTAPRATEAQNKQTQMVVDSNAQVNRNSTSPALNGEGIISVGFSGASLR